MRNLLRHRRLIVGFCLGLLAGVAWASPAIMKHEPPPGSLGAGRTVLVDDGRCPRGEVDAVTGGDTIGRHGHHGTTPRSYRCVPRPG